MNAHGIEDLHERAGLAIDGVPRHYGHDHTQSADVEHEDSPNNIIGGARNRGLRILGFAGGDADELGAAEAEHHHNQCHQQAGPGTVGILPHQAVREEAVTHGEPVREACAHAGCGGQSEDDDGQAADDHGDHGHNLDNGEPELELTELGDAQQVGGADNHQEHGRRHPCRNRREPVVYEFAHHGQLNHRDEDVIEPVVPTGDEAGALGPVASGVVAERARLRILNGHFAQRAHDHEDCEAANQVGEQNRGAGQRDGFAGTIEQAGSDGAAQCNQLDMTVLQ